MKIKALAATLFATTVLAGGSVLAQMSTAVTMQPVPNPPAKLMMKHHMMKKHMKHHMMKKHMMAKDGMAPSSADAMSTPAPK